MVLTDGVHLMGTDMNQLHSFAKKIGLKRSWFQGESRNPHYDLTSSRMVIRAVRAGAKAVAYRGLIKALKGGSCNGVHG